MLVKAMMLDTVFHDNEMFFDVEIGTLIWHRHENGITLKIILVNIF